MKLRASVHQEDEPMGTENRIRIVAKRWGNSNSSPDSLDSSCRYSYENDQINVPVMNAQVSASLALVALPIVSMALAAECTHQCQLSGERHGSEPHQGILIQPPNWIGLLAPMIGSGRLAVVHAGIGCSCSGWVLLPFGIACTGLMSQAIVGVSWNRHATRSEGAK
jgi:hypothetical protein